jgi:hypothetical protein
VSGDNDNDMTQDNDDECNNYEYDNGGDWDGPRTQISNHRHCQCWVWPFGAPKSGSFSSGWVVNHGVSWCATVWTDIANIELTLTDC